MATIQDARSQSTPLLSSGSNRPFSPIPDGTISSFHFPASSQLLAISTPRRGTLPLPPRPNTCLSFKLYDPDDAPLIISPSPFKFDGWLELLQDYPDRRLVQALSQILTRGCHFEFKGEPSLSLSKNLKSAELDLPFLRQSIQDNLQKNRVIQANPTFPFIISPLGLVPKSDGG